MRRFPEAPYDVDVAVIGGGPAGMSAAVRCRWVKSYRSLPCSVAVFEPGPLGGLAGWRTCSITGPGYRYLGDGLIQRIKTDFERYQIPVVHERVVSLKHDGQLFTLETEAGTAVRALSVIIATGMREGARLVAGGLEPPANVPTGGKCGGVRKWMWSPACSPACPPRRVARSRHPFFLSTARLFC